MTRRLLAMPWLQTATALLALGCAALLRAQDSPVVVGQTPETHPLWLSPPQTTLELLYRYQADRTGGSSAADSSQREGRFEETLQLATSGFIYHPNLLDLRLGGAFGLKQTSFDGNDAAADENGTIYEWDVSGTFLRKEPVSLTLYSQRQHETVDRQFGRSLDTTLTSTGGNLDVRFGPLPTRIGAFHSTQQQSDTEDPSGFDLSRDTLTWHTGFFPSDNQSVTLDYTFESVSESTGTSASQSFDTNDLALSHGLQFGSHDQHSLESSFGYHDQTGDQEREQVRWDEGLRLRHTDRFETYYRYVLDRQSYGVPDQTQDLQTVEAGFRHQLYQSLATHGTVGVRDLQRSDDGNSTARYGLLQADYRKEVPLGLLNVGLSGGQEREEFDDSTGPTLVRDVRIVLTDDGPTTIVGSQILPESVLITDITGLLLYTSAPPDPDYQVVAFPDHIEITRVIGGRIASGQTVLVDYELAPTSGHTTTTDTLSASVRYDIRHGFLNGLGLYAREFHQDQAVDASDAKAPIPNSLVETVFGVDYRFWRMTVGAERRNHDSTISPYEMDRLFARYGQRLRSSTSLNLSAVYTSSTYSQTGNEVDVLLLSGCVRQQISSRLQGSFTVLWLDRQDALNFNSQGFEQNLELRWTLRQTTAHLQLRNATNDNEVTSQTHQYLRLGLRRTF